MDFTVFTSGGIDYSPAPWVVRTTLVLEEPELRDADDQRFARFWKVWHAERSTYAPKLVELTLVLRPGYTDGAADLRGIHTFLDYYRSHIESTCETKGLNVYLDNYSALQNGMHYMVSNVPKLLFTI